MAVLLTKGEIRCYCDAAHCVATGYMCKSELSACFSRLLDPQNTNSPLTHGCLDSLASTADICRAKQAQNHSGPTMPTLECCHEDMCNYRGLHDVLSPPKSEASGQGNRYQHDSSRNLITKQVSCLQIKVLLSAELRRPSRVPFTVQTRLSYEFQLPMTTVHAPVHKGEDLLVAEICLPHFVAGQTAVLLPTDGHHAL